MKTVGLLIKRNTKLFFRDKGMFFTSLITPLILLVLYATFLANVYETSFASALPSAIDIPDKVLDALVGGQLVSSLLAVCCVTVAFCSNFLMVQDKVNGSRGDLTIAPVKASTLAIGYYVSTFIVTLAICLVATAAGFIYLACIGWYLSVTDVMLVLLDVLLLVLFGVALSSVVNYFLTSQGQISAVGTVVSAGYGFICGAYMPISSFDEWLQKALSFLPGTYGTALLRNHAMRGALGELEALGIPAEALDGLRDGVDCNVYFFGSAVDIPYMYLILSGAAVLFVAAYVLMNRFCGKKSK